MKNKEIKLIATDLDGTLFSRFGELSAYAEEVLKQARRQGIKIVISSGRPYYSVQRSIPDDCYDYASCMNGQVIVDKKTGSAITKRNLSSEEISRLASLAHQYPVVLACSIHHEFVHYCSPNQKWKYSIYQFAKKVRAKIKHEKFYNEKLCTDFSHIQDEEIGKICFSSSPKTLQKIISEIEHQNFSYFLVSPVWLEVQPHGISKGFALKEIMQMEGLTSDVCAAIGDGENDIPMFEVAGTSVAMKNAMKTVKKAATDEADAFFNDGCAKWIAEHIKKA